MECKVAIIHLLVLQLAKNKQLTRFFVRNLNAEPDEWDFPEATFDAVVCCVSVQYLQQPEKTFAEIYRVLRPGGVCIMAFSNRLYSSKGADLSPQNKNIKHLQLKMKAGAA